MLAGEIMPLTLKITSKHRHILGADSTHVFSVHGGSIGRAPDNDWVLPDPDRYISGQHARIEYRDGAYYLTDKSSNGVYVNDSDQPVGRGTSLRLYDGDALRMGDYRFQVSIVHVSLDEASDATADRDSPADAVAASAPRIDDAGKTGSATGASASVAGESSPVRLKLLEERAEELASAPPPEPATHGDTVVYADSRGPAKDDVLSETAVLREDFLASQSGIGRRPEPGPHGDAEPGLEEAVRLLLEATGLDPGRIPPGSERELLVTYGHVMRATVEGLLAVLRTRSLIKGQFRLSQTTIQEAGNNPLKFAPGVQDALEQLFYRETPEYMEPLEATENALGDIRAHEVAMVSAMKAAVKNLLEQLEPDVLEEKFSRGFKRGGLLGGGNKSRYWDLYCDLFQVVAGHSDENFVQVLGPKFAEAYEREIHRLTGHGRRSKGAGNA